MNHLAHPAEYRPAWTNRRRAIWGALMTAMGSVWVSLGVTCYLAVFGSLTAVEAGAFAWFGTVGFAAGVWIVNTYVFGAASDDANFLEFLKSWK